MPALWSGTPGEIFLRRRGILTRFAEISGTRFSAAWYGRPAVLFPVNDHSGNLVSVSGRYVDGGRFLKTQAAGRTSLGVFSTPNALESAVIAIVEGPIDAFSLALCGLPAMAMLGTRWTEWLPKAVASKTDIQATFTSHQANLPKPHGRSAFSLPAPENLQKEKNAGPPKKTGAQLS